MQQGRDNKPHIGIYGKRNVGKSSLINCISGQNVSIVSDFKGTTTDPVKRSFEILDYAPVIFIDTAGIDDEGETGKKRIQKTIDTINTIDIAIIVVADGNFDENERFIISKLKKNDIPFFIVNNKADIAALNEDLRLELKNEFNVPVIDFSTLNNKHVATILDTIKQIAPERNWQQQSLLGDKISRNDVVLLITPIDSEAPQGRMILPQVQVIRDCLDNNCIVVVLQDTEIKNFLSLGIKPKLAITDSQVFNKVKTLILNDIPLTSFSIVLARSKGNFDNYLKGTSAISTLKDNDKILILESCSHHISCEDIGRIKLPAALQKFTGKTLNFDFVAGLGQIPDEVTNYSLIIQCGGCMATRKQLASRLRPAIEAGVPVSNYGMALAYTSGIFDKAVEIFRNF